MASDFFGKAARLWGGGGRGRGRGRGGGGSAGGASSAPQYYDLACPDCARPIRGRRGEGYQAVRCPDCGGGLFVLPRGPFAPPPELPEAVARRNRRKLRELLDARAAALEIDPAEEGIGVGIEAEALDELDDRFEPVADDSREIQWVEAPAQIPVGATPADEDEDEWVEPDAIDIEVEGIADSDADAELVDVEWVDAEEEEAAPPRARAETGPGPGPRAGGAPGAKAKVGAADGGAKSKAKPKSKPEPKSKPVAAPAPRRMIHDFDLDRDPDPIPARPSSSPASASASAPAGAGVGVGGRRGRDDRRDDDRDHDQPDDGGDDYDYEGEGEGEGDAEWLDARRAEARAERARRWRRRRPWLVFLAVALVLGGTVAFRVRQQRLQEYPRWVAEGIEEGIPALERGDFDLAKQLLNRAAAGVRGLGGQVEGATDVLQAAAEASIFADLVGRPLDQLVEDAARARSAEEFAETFRVVYRGTSVLLDAVMEDDGRGGTRPALTILSGPGPRPDRVARFDASGFRLLELLELPPGSRLVFGARLEGLELDRETGEWRIRLQPNGGAVITRLAALEALGWPSADAVAGGDAGAGAGAGAAGAGGGGGGGGGVAGADPFLGFTREELAARQGRPNLIQRVATQGATVEVWTYRGVAGDQHVVFTQRKGEPRALVTNRYVVSARGRRDDSAGRAGSDG